MKRKDKTTKEDCDNFGPIEYVGTKPVLKDNPTSQPIITDFPTPTERKLEKEE